MSGCILHLAISHSPVFLVNSCLDRFAAPRLICEDPFSRSYGVILPSSLTVNLPSALVYSTRPRVSVYGTGAHMVLLSGFSREHDYLRFRSARRLRVLSALGSEPGFAWVPQHLTAFNALFRQCAGVSLLRLHFAHMINVARETLVLRRGGILPPLALLIPTFAFPWPPTAVVPQSSTAHGMLPYRCFKHPMSSAAAFIPDYYPCRVPRLVSCYALFE